MPIGTALFHKKGTLATFIKMFMLTSIKTKYNCISHVQIRLVDQTTLSLQIKKSFKNGNKWTVKQQRPSRTGKNCPFVFTSLFASIYNTHSKVNKKRCKGETSSHTHQDSARIALDNLYIPSLKPLS